MTIDPREVARWARIVSANRLICVRADDWMNCGNGGTHHGGADFCTPIGRLAEGFDGLAREVARWAAKHAGSRPGCDAFRGFYRHRDNMDGFYPQRRDLAARLGNLHLSDPMDLLTTNPPPRQCAIPLLVELCAGTAALSLRLERAGARPPVSRMGAKTGYADAILALAGLNPGDKAEHYLWCEPDDGVRLLLHAYRDADLAREAAAIIRSWADEEPRALWERLRAEGPARCPPVDAREVGRWTFVQRVTGRGAAWGANCDLNGNGGCDPRTGQRYPFNLHKNSIRLSGGLPATIHDDATTAPVPVPVPPGTLVYMDPPYLNTTGYAHDLGRDEVVALARRWADAGARVMISEAEPIPELVADGWHAVKVTHMRVGQKRTFSKQQAEWVTCSFQPDARAVRACEIAAERAEREAAALRGGDQVSLFGGPS